MVLVAGILVSVPAFVLSAGTDNIWSVRYLLPALVFGHILLARRLAAVQDPRLAALVLAIIVVPRAAFTGILVAAPPSPRPAARVAAWLQDRGLTHGYAPYWDASITTLEAGGRVRVRAVTFSGSALVPYRWYAREEWFSDGSPARFVLYTRPGLIDPSEPQRDDSGFPTAAEAAFGPPAGVFDIGRYRVLVWERALPALAG
jgi:hypothetical protein